MMSGTSEGSGLAITEASTKFTKLYIDRIKKEEDEEQWISGEELFTEGSSEEDAKSGKPHRIKKEYKGAHPKVYKERLSPRRGTACRSQNLPMKGPEPGGEDSDCEEPVISWKPKRGSIKLPNLVKETDAARSSETIVE